MPGRNVYTSVNQGAFDAAVKNGRFTMKEEVKTTRETLGKAISDFEEEPAEATGFTKLDGKQTVDCRDRCMHCGTHCIYLNTKQEEQNMNIGVFLALEPYTSIERQLQLAKEAGFTCADITDVHEGSSMFNSAGLAATVSLDGDPFATKRLFEKYGITPSTVCVHGALLEPSNPRRSRPPAS